jgi:hypothetical protein
MKRTARRLAGGRGPKPIGPQPSPPKGDTVPHPRTPIPSKIIGMLRFPRNRGVFLLPGRHCAWVQTQGGEP